MASITYRVSGRPKEGNDHALVAQADDDAAQATKKVVRTFANTADGLDKAKVLTIRESRGGSTQTIR